MEGHPVNISVKLFSILIISFRGDVHSKIDKTKILMTNGSLMQVESMAECSPCNTFDLH